MISKEMGKRLNEQLNVELRAWYKYTAMAIHADLASLKGFAHWFTLQAEEEREHAMRIARYLLDQDQAPKLLPIEQPKSDFSSPVEIFEAALASEQFVTKCITDLSASARKEGDEATLIFLQWFVSEQVEEEAQVRDILDRLKLVGSDGQGLLLIDQELGKRTAE